MKTISKMKEVIIPVLLIVPIWISGFTGPDKKTEPQACLEVSGQIVRERKLNEKPIRVELIRENKLVDSMLVRGSEDFKFSLQKNQYYAVRVLQEGYLPRLVSISTYLPEDIKADKKFRFHFDLIQVSNKERTADMEDVIDFPIALICYNESKGYFDYNAFYTSHIKEVYQKLKTVTIPFYTTSL